MEFLPDILGSDQLPVVTALLLGLLTAISPCPLATNVTAIGFISRGVSEKGRVLWSGVLYALGRTMAYSVLGGILIYILRTGAESFDLEQAVSEWGERLIGPVLTIVGILMLVGEHISLGGKFGFQGGPWAERLSGPAGAFVLGVLFALAFCPTSGLLYFGMLIPLAVSSAGGYLLPVAYAIATALPVLLVAWLLAFSIRCLGAFMGGVAKVQKWLNRLVAVLFIAVGIYYIYVFFIA